MGGFTLRYRSIPDDAEIRAVEAVVRRYGGRAVWERTQRPACAYALVENAGAECAAELASAARAEIVDSPIIALAVFPHAAEALPFLQNALGAAGRPAGIVRCETVDGAVLVEWDMEKTRASLIVGLIDVELARFGGGRTARVLAPMPAAWAAAIASDGLQAPDLTPDRVLETLLEEHGAAGR